MKPNMVKSILAIMLISILNTPVQAKQRSHVIGLGHVWIPNLPASKCPPTPEDLNQLILDSQTLATRDAVNKCWGNSVIRISDWETKNQCVWHDGAGIQTDAWAIFKCGVRL